MAETAFAVWLNTFFAGYDHLILSVLHALAGKLGFALTPLMHLVTLIGEKGLVFYLLAFILALFADTRDFGVCIFGAVCCGALITNIILKDTVARPRPFASADEFYVWWEAIGAPAEDGFSFPSGHVTSCAAGMTAICCMKGKRFVVPSVVIVFVMALARNYLMVHYPSDVLFAAVIGVFSGFVAWLITKAIFRFLRRHFREPLPRFLLCFDLSDLLPSLRRAAQRGGKAKKAASGKNKPVRRREAERADIPVASFSELDDDGSDGSELSDDADAQPRRPAEGRHARSTGKPALKKGAGSGAYRGRHEL